MSESPLVVPERRGRGRFHAVPIFLECELGHDPLIELNDDLRRAVDHLGRDAYDPGRGTQESRPGAAGRRLAAYAGLGVGVELDMPVGVGVGSDVGVESESASA